MTIISQKQSPEEKAELLSRLTFSWFSETAETGSKKDLTDEDLPNINSRDTSDKLVEQWTNVWDDLCKNAKRRKTKPSLYHALFGVFRRGWIGLTVLRVFMDLLQFINPILLKYLIDFVENPSEPLLHGIALSVILLLNSQLRTHTKNFFLYKQYQFGNKIQSMLRNVIFRKALHLSTTSRSTHSAGQMLNLMSTDSENIVRMLRLVHSFWSAPFQIVICMVLLWFTLGISALGGIIVMVLFSPVNYLSSKLQKKFQVKQMKVKDARLKTCHEAFEGIKVVKLYTWEEPLEKKINEDREVEIRHLRSASLVNQMAEAANCAVPFLVAAISFGTYVSLSTTNQLTPQKAFVSLTLFNMIREPLRIFTVFINGFVQASVSQKRIRDFLLLNERENEVREKASSGNAVELHSLTTNWTGPNELPVLSEISEQFPKGSFTVIVGAVGTGKSSLLNAILGEMHKLSGSVRVTGTIAFAPQQPWLMNATMRENITLGKPFNAEFYDKVVEACQLKSDFALFPSGDQTEVGGKGDTLSGGQKARLGLARAVYQDTDIYLLDDVLSAVDAHVGSAIFDKVLSSKGLLAKKTCLFVTHGLHFTRGADKVLVMRDGAVFNVTEVSGDDEIMTALQAEIETPDELESDVPEEVDVVTEKSKSRAASVVSKARTNSIKHRNSVLEKKEKESNLLKDLGKTTEEEKLGTGRVSAAVYILLMKAATMRFSLVYISFMIANHVMLFMRSVWLSKWSDAAVTGNGTMSNEQWLAGYATFGMLEVFTIAIALLFLVFASQSASINLHNPLLHTVFRSTMAFFDTTPLGRILNRFARDIDVIDTQIPVNVRNLSVNLLQVLMILCSIIYSTPAFIVIVIPLALINMRIMKYYIPTSRQLNRLESIKLSPLLSTFGESIRGVTSIRVYNKIDSTSLKFSEEADSFLNCRSLSTAGLRWIVIRLECLSNTVIFMAALLGVISTRFTTISPGLVGLSVSFAFMITDTFNLAVMYTADLETNIVSVERVKEYTENAKEPEWTSKSPPKEEWPQDGKIEWKDYSLRYRNGLPLVIKKLSASIHSGEKVAIVGRTGSGKSSLTLGLFRLIEAADGEIDIDSLNISNIGLHELRSKITIIPQDPVLFSGTLRFNLDPFDQRTDQQIWEALDSCQLKTFVDANPEKLEYIISEGGSNMSIGQRQLICLVRALLRKGKILILDEATAAVDYTTDALVQKVIRNQFANSTVIAIAHRLNTVANYDRIMVLDKGEIVEFESPEKLLQDPNSSYYQMVKKSNEHQQ